MDVMTEEHGPAAGHGQVARFRLARGETVHLLHPKQIIAYRGSPDGRKDRLMNLKGMYRKRKLIQADMSGPSEFLAALPPGYFLKSIPIGGGSDLLFEFRHLFYYTSGIEMENRLLRLKQMWITKDWMKIKFSGSGTIGILTCGPVYEAALDPVEPLFVDSRSIVAYPERAKVELCVYGNHLASQHMNMQWKITGSGCALIQTGSGGRELEHALHGDGIMKRVLREVLPFGGVFIK